MSTIAECLRRAIELTGSDSARLDTEVLLAHILQVDRAWLFTWPEQILSRAQQQQFNALFERRAEGEPVAYLTGEREFWSLPLKVNPSTLIPRPDTEVLVEQALSLSLPKNARVLDLGTGSGAIALALASENPDWAVTAVDVSADIVELAKGNALRLNIGNVSVLESDWFSALACREAEFQGRQQFDLIVSNPPYIDPDDAHLAQGDVAFEPRSALVAADRGYGDIEKIVSEAALHLSPEGWLILEHGFEQGATVRDMLVGHGFVAVVTVQDLAGNDRVSVARKGHDNGSL